MWLQLLGYFSYRKAAHSRWLKKKYILQGMVQGPLMFGTHDSDSSSHDWKKMQPIPTLPDILAQATIPQRLRFVLIVEKETVYYTLASTKKIDAAWCALTLGFSQAIRSFVRGKTQLSAPSLFQLAIA